MSRRRFAGVFAAAGVGVAVMSAAWAATPEVRTQAKIFFEPHIPTALRRALEYAGDDGFVASMPQLMHASPEPGAPGRGRARNKKCVQVGVET